MWWVVGSFKGWSGILPKAKSTLIGISFLVSVLLLYNFSSFLFTGFPTIPSLQNRWWAGYYDSHLYGRQWCVAVFDQDSTGKIRMALLSRIGRPDALLVTRNSSDPTFVNLILEDDLVRFEAKQLYSGRRYIYQRLLVGRFNDFWKVNNDISIRGTQPSLSPPNEFALEPVDYARLTRFWQAYVGRADGMTPEELLESAGFPVPAQ
jgi:hypothetical protein